MARTADEEQRLLARNTRPLSAPDLGAVSQALAAAAATKKKPVTRVLF